MQIITLDFETFYSKEYSLSKITTEEYINDLYFDVVGVAVKINDGETQWFSGNSQATYDFLHRFDWPNAMLVCHNAMFDAAILAWRFGIHPKILTCTLSMARAIHGTEVGGSLAKLSTYYGFGEKGTEVIQALGKRRVEFTPTDLAAYGEYCRNDVELTYKLFNKLIPKFSKTELKLIDMTLRMYTKPTLQLDAKVLRQHLYETQKQKEELLSTCGIEKAELMSNEKFAEVLRSFGVEPPMKISNTTGKETYAFAKTDEEFKALAEHDDTRVQALVAARLGTKSTIEETRTERFLSIEGRLHTYPELKHTLPVPLQYYGAKTGRWSASERTNLQNLPRKSKLKQAIVAPNGHVIVGADLSNIELRVGLWFAGQLDKLAQLGNGLDLYKDFASSVFGVAYDEVNDTQRFLGKTCIAEDELVLTNRGLVPIQNVKVDDKVWDGVEWVTHDGLIYQGEKNVISYQGLTATPDHIVYLEDGTSCEFKDAANQGASIAVTGNDREAVLLMENNQHRDKEKQQSRGDVDISPMQVWDAEVDAPRVTNPWAIKTVSLLCNINSTSEAPASKCNRQFDSKAPKTSQCHETKVYQSKGQRVQKLWGAGYSFYVRFYSRMCELYENATPMLSRTISRPNRQQRALRSGESSFCGYENPNKQQKKHSYSKLERAKDFIIRLGTEPLRTIIYGNQIFESRYDRGRNHSPCLGVSTQQMQVLETVEKKVRVYDILNAGPRHRFTVNNLLVSNCQLSLIYGTGAAKLQAQVKQMSGVELGAEDARRIVMLYRQEYASVAGVWKQGQKALEAVKNNNLYSMGHKNIIEFHGEEGALLPSGLYMRYPDLRSVTTDKGVEWSVALRKGMRDKLYGSKVFQGLTQAMARCIIGESMVRIQKEYPIALTIHDACYVVAPEKDADTALRLVVNELKVPPTWMPDIPLDAEGGYGASLDFKMGKI